MLIDLCDVGFAYGDALILDNINITINYGDRIGLIGRNGAGKTTLLKLINKELSPTSGTIRAKDRLVCGYLKQNQSLDSPLSAYQEMLEVFAGTIAAISQLEVLSKRISHTSHDTQDYMRLVHEYDQLSAFIAAKDGYSVDVKIKTVLNGMGFAGRYEQVVATMSGGEKTRLAIAKLLLESPELLVLDEPTNHLDFKTLSWLENYLNDYKGSIIVVSHDRYFLDRMVTRIWEIEDSKLDAYNGNYSAYKLIKKEIIAYKLKEYEKQQIKIAAMQDYIARNICRATTANSAKSRVHQLENMQILEKPRTAIKTPVFYFNYDTESNKNVLSVSDFTLEIAGKALINNANFDIKKGERVAILGENGTGKSTLIRAIAANNRPNIKFGKDVKATYYDQENLNLNYDNTVIDELWGRHHKESQTKIRSILGGLLLNADDINKPVRVLSGGERAKLGLAIVMADKANTLILDEPTNHLDLVTREALEEALLQFGGTLIFVSHDRYFINRLASAVLEIDNRSLLRYDGNFDYYENIKKAKQQEVQNIKPPEKNTSYRSAKERSQNVRDKQRLAELEKLIAALETEILELEQTSLQPDILADYLAYKQIDSLLSAQKLTLEGYYSEWMTLSGQ